MAESNLNAETNRADQLEDELLDINNVRRNWRQVEDFGVAYNMQRDEFNSHFDQNRTERRTMQVDTRLTKEEQRLEDQYAAEYHEQLRLDREKEDEMLARKMQEELNLEEENQRKKLLDDDEAIARRLQESEGTVSPEDAKFNFPPAVPAFVAKIIQDAHDRAKMLNLPANLTAEQLDAIFNTVKDISPRLAQEVKDYQLALRLLRKEDVVPSNDFPPLSNARGRLSEPVPAAKSTVSLSIGRRSAEVTDADSARASSSRMMIEQKNVETHDVNDLISFDDGAADLRTRSQPAAHISESSRVDCFNRQEHRGPSVSLAGVSRGHKDSTHHYSQPSPPGSSPNSNPTRSCTRGPSPNSTGPTRAYVNSSGVKVIPRSMFQ